MSTPESLVPSPDARVSPACGDHRRRRRLPMAFLHHLNSIQEWNRVFLLVCAAGLVIDPLFFYSLSISAGRLCLFVDGWFAVSVTVLRCMADLVHLVNVYLQLAAGPGDAHYTPSPASAVNGAEARGSGAPRARGYLRSKTGFLLDLFIVLPIPQVIIIKFPSISSAVAPDSWPHDRCVSFADCSVDCNSGYVTPRDDNESDDGVLHLLRVPVLSKDLPLRLLPAQAAEHAGLRLRHHLGRNRSQFDRLLRGLTCNY